MSNQCSVVMQQVFDHAGVAYIKPKPFRIFCGPNAEKEAEDWVMSNTVRVLGEPNYYVVNSVEIACKVENCLNSQFPETD